MIETFRDEYNWLSNFALFERPLKFSGGLSFPTNEHFYVAMKTKDHSERVGVCLHPLKGLKSYGRSLTLREDWEDIKQDVMLYGLRYKFSPLNPSLRNKLISTGDQYIQEGNWWRDIYWGVCLRTGEGENHLGKLIMQIREEIRNEGR
ncbi:MAG: hypothetical protein GOVbin4162_72 [Prokaryotic dsDNA virus sp.]|nr:MAG: hypothetical protein GOVbin4162_72 [Prokaryotic dsDNA virus sp.]|tara:strand:+ start:20178 stop:20621 length:444 start_codon:yes stop_codon:yes gene_type:complete